MRKKLIDLILPLPLPLILSLIPVLGFSQITDGFQRKLIINKHSIVKYGGLERADTSHQNIFLMFTGHDFNDGGSYIRKLLKRENVKAHFFFTGDFYRAEENESLIKKLKNDDHYLGAHSDKHLLYASWEKRDSLLVSKSEFTADLLNNYQAMEVFGIKKIDAPFFMPPYEWYNQQISDWTKEQGFQLINYTPGTRSNADYTTPIMDNYISSERIYHNILDYERQSTNGLNGFLLLIHIGTHPARVDKLYKYLPQLIDILRERGYHFRLLTH